MPDSFSSGGSWKRNVDNYYTYKQTSGGGNGGGGSSKGKGWTIAAILLFAIQGLVTAGILGMLAVLGLFGITVLIIYLIRKQLSKPKKENEKATGRQTVISSTSRSEGISTMPDSTANKKSFSDQNCMSKEYRDLIQYYTPIFNGKKLVADIIDAYIENTNQSALFCDLNLRYLGLYLYAFKLTEERWDTKKIQTTINNLLNAQNKES